MAFLYARINILNKKSENHSHNSLKDEIPLGINQTKEEEKPLKFKA